LKIENQTMKTQIDFKRALCGAAVGAGMFSDVDGRNQPFTAENVAWVSDTQTGKVLTKGRSSAGGLNGHEDFAKPLVGAK
jgi:hypothetical protein